MAVYVARYTLGVIYSYFNIEVEEVMTSKQHINMLGAYCGLSQAAIAEKIGLTRQGLYKRLARNTLTPDDMAKIAEAVGAEYKSVFVFPDGKEI